MTQINLDQRGDGRLGPAGVQGAAGTKAMGAKAMGAKAPGRPRTVLPVGAEAFIRRRIEESIGLGLLVLAAALFLGYLSYFPGDPSPLKASPGPVRNILGGFGATSADIGLQTLGLAYLLFIGILGGWGWRLFSHQGLPTAWLRVTLLPPTVILGALAAGALPDILGGSGPSGPGGVIGELVLRPLTRLGPMLGGIGSGTIGLIAAGAAVIMTIFTLGFSPVAVRQRLDSLHRQGVERRRRKADRAAQAAATATTTATTTAADLDDRGARGGLSAAFLRKVAGLKALVPSLRKRPDNPYLPPPSGPSHEGDGWEDDPWSREPGFGPDRMAERMAERMTERRAEPSLGPTASPDVPFSGIPSAGFGQPVPQLQPLPLDLPTVARPNTARPDTARPALPAAASAARRTAARSTASGTLELTLDPATARLPPVALLSTGDGTVAPAVDPATLEQQARLLETVLQDFGVRGQIINARPGPVVTLYELDPAPGTKSARVIGLADDIARSMSALAVRIAVVPGRTVIGIELPNPKRQTVLLRDMLTCADFEQTAGKLPLVLGKDIGGSPVVADLARMPHLLIAGTTGSGKSVGINAMILSLLYRFTPEQCRLIMIDPKMLELSVYDGIPHLLTPVVTDPKKAVVALKWAVREMENRYRAMSKLGVRNIEGYNAKVLEITKAGQESTRRVQIGFDEATGEPLFEEQPLNLDPLPFIVVIVDEMADLMLVAGKEIEAAIQRLAQMARAAGIHLIMATQRPSVDVITGTIKANFPTRISFMVTSKIDSRTILGESGAEQLLGQGDMLYMAGGGRLTRVHGPFVSDGEVEQVVGFLKRTGQPHYIDGITEDEEDAGEFGAGEDGEGAGGADDPLFDQAVALVARERKASTSFIQRHLQIGYNRAARLIDLMEAQGMVSPANHVGKREVLLPENR